MDYISLIGSVGFPIVACICMALFVKDILEKQREEVRALNEHHTKEMMSFKEDITKALNNNTIAITRLCEKIEKGEKENETFKTRID